MPQGNSTEDLGAVESQPLTENEDSLQHRVTVTRSHYALTKEEIAKGIANRFVHSRTYILLYLIMAALSITTVVLSMVQGCPTLAFYILEVIINTTMIAEVSIRLLAYGRLFWKSPFNILDLILTLFCALTLLVIAFAGCGSSSKQEEILDTLLLVGRNVLQFGRLASVMRQSGQSIFSHPKPIDLSAARRSGYSLDIDMAAEEEYSRSAGYNQVLFDAPEEELETTPQERPPPPRPKAPLIRDDRDAEDMWASLG